MKKNTLDEMLNNLFNKTTENPMILIEVFAFKEVYRIMKKSLKEISVYMENITRKGDNATLFDFYVMRQVMKMLEIGFFENKNQQEEHHAVETE